jgi:hypothetical protein
MAPDVAPLPSPIDAPMLAVPQPAGVVDDVVDPESLQSPARAIAVGVAAAVLLLLLALVIVRLVL